MRFVPVLAALVAFLGVTVAATLAPSPVPPPRFSFSTSVVAPGQTVTVRLTRRPHPFKQAIRLYLVPEVSAGRVKSRSDARLTFVGSVTPGRSAERFTVPPLEPGLYALAYWCRGCPLPRGKQLAVLRLTLLRVGPPASASSCPVTIPNGAVPAGLEGSPHWHGNRALWVIWLPLDGVSTTKEADGSLFWKMIWVAAGAPGRLTVRYERLDSASPPLDAETIAGRLSIYNGPSWASRMYFTVGCWQVTARVRDVTLSFVLAVVRG